MIHLLSRIMSALSQRWMRRPCNGGFFRETILGGLSHVDDLYCNWSGDRPALVALYLLSCIRILNEYQRGVIFRLGLGGTAGSMLMPGA